MTAEGLERLARYDWPGNLRELANVLERATILSPGAGAGAGRVRSARRARADGGVRGTG